jgi:guanylate kinase
MMAGKVAYDLIYEWDVKNDSLMWFGDIDGMLGFKKGDISRNINAWLNLIHPDDAELLEYAVVYKDYKGIPKSQVRKALASGKNVIMRIDVQGAETVRKLAKDALLIFLTPQDEEELIRRLEKRDTETKESLKLRIATARQEYKNIGLFDYIVVNRDDRLEETVDNIEAIIKAEQQRVDQRVVEL